MTFAALDTGAAVHHLRDLLDDGDIRLVDGQDKVLLLVREHTGHNVDRRDIGRLLLPNEEYHARHIVAEVQLGDLM